MAHTTGNIAASGDTIHFLVPHKGTYIYNAGTVDDRETACHTIIDLIVYAGLIPDVRDTLEQEFVINSISRMQLANAKLRRQYDIESLLGELCRAFNIDVEIKVKASNGLDIHNIHDGHNLSSV